MDLLVTSGYPLWLRNTKDARDGSDRSIDEVAKSPLLRAAAAPRAEWSRLEKFAGWRLAV